MSGVAEGPMALYRARVAEGALDADPAQRLAVEKLQLLAMRLADYNPAKPKRVGLGRFGWGRDRLEEKPVPGLYLYGGVGRGKSMLMDLFFAAAPVERKRRVHFHAFMQEMHAGIARARAEGVTDPVRPVADAMADQATLLCFDEMQITDITDAMLVGRLFERLFERGVVVVTTSNRAPDALYKDGLNRNLFMPFIAMLKERLEVHELESATDHRLDRLKGAEVYHAPLGAGGDGGARRGLGAAGGGAGGAIGAQGAGADGDAARAAQRRRAGVVRGALRGGARAGGLSRHRRGGGGADPRRHPAAQPGEEQRGEAVRDAGRRALRGEGAARLLGGGGAGCALRGGGGGVRVRADGLAAARDAERGWGR